MVNWTKFDPSVFELEFNEEKLGRRNITPTEAAEVLWNGVRPYRDKDYDDRYWWAP